MYKFYLPSGIVIEEWINFSKIYSKIRQKHYDDTGDLFLQYDKKSACNDLKSMLHVKTKTFLEVSFYRIYCHLYDSYARIIVE